MMQIAPNTNDADPSIDPEQPRALGKAAGKGFSWLTLSLLMGKVFLSLSQVVLGWILTDVEFGVFAIAVSIIGFVKIFHDGGVPQVLVQRGKDEFLRLQGAAFWISLAVSCLAGVLLAAASPWIARFYDDDRLIAMLVVTAIALPLGSPSNLMRARLQIDLRFSMIALLAAGRFFIRSISTVIFALLGYGALSFILPLLLIALFENAVTYASTRITPWLSPVLFREWPALVKDAYWVVAATVCRGLARYGSYLVFGVLLTKDLLGQYFFGFQLTIQVTILVALNLRHVLFPVMAKLADQPQRQSNALLRTIRLLMLVGAPTSMLVASMIAPLEEFVWHGNWATSVPLMQIFAILAPLLMISDIVQAALNSRGRFRTAGYLTFFEGCWVVATSWLAVMLAGATNISGIAFWAAGLQVLYVVVVSGWILKSFDIRTVSYLRGFLMQWLVALVAVLLTWVVQSWLPSEMSALARTVLQGIFYSVTYTAMARMLLSSDLLTLASVAPRKLAQWIRLLFWLPKEIASGES